MVHRAGRGRAGRGTAGGEGEGGAELLGEDEGAEGAGRERTVEGVESGVLGVGGCVGGGCFGGWRGGVLGRGGGCEVRWGEQRTLFLCIVVI